MRLLVEEAKTA